jgi:hypothetical protein
MSSRNEEERERLKQEYKEHYQRIKEAREKLKSSQRSTKIKQALDNMNPDSLLESVDEFLGKVQEKVTGVEARLDVAMDSLSSDDSSDTSGESLEEKMKREDEMRKIKAREALKQMKIEMGMLYSEIEKTAEEIKAHKTIGKEEDQEEDPNTEQQNNS